jgi:hypothetical protein
MSMAMQVELEGARTSKEEKARRALRLLDCRGLRLEKAGEDRIKEICEIAWPPKGTSAEKVSKMMLWN